MNDGDANDYNNDVDDDDDVDDDHYSMLVNQ